MEPYDPQKFCQFSLRTTQFSPSISSVYVLTVSRSIPSSDRSVDRSQLMTIPLLLHHPQPACPDQAQTPNAQNTGRIINRIPFLKQRLPVFTSWKIFWYFQSWAQVDNSILTSLETVWPTGYRFNIYRSFFLFPSFWISSDWSTVTHLDHVHMIDNCQIVLCIQQTVTLSLECYFIKFIDTISLFIYTFLY